MNQKGRRYRRLDGENRTKILSVRMSEREYEEVQARGDRLNMSMSDYMRWCALDVRQPMGQLEARIVAMVQDALARFDPSYGETP